MARTGQLSLLAVFAHPDDESFATGGTMAKYAREGVRVSLVCATRGEVGEISDPALATPATLGQVREGELRAACALLGIQTLQFLDYVDGTLPEMDRRKAVGKVVRAIREIRPHVLVTWGPEGGGSGHPDHVTIHDWTVDAFEAAGDPSAFPEQLQAGLEAHQPRKLYCLAQPRQRFQRLGEMAKRFTEGTSWDNRNWSTYGVPEERITTVIDTREYAATRLEAIATHQTQFSPRHPYALLPRDLIVEFFGQESYILAGSHVDPPGGREDDLFCGLR
ncbi:MAG TPA: PIG-L deacetylase family protein [Chloroflexota bacterium]